jgi:hypothetical protein
MVSRILPSGSSVPAASLVIGLPSPAAHLCISFRIVLRTPSAPMTMS